MNLFSFQIFQCFPLFIDWFSLKRYFFCALTLKSIDTWCDAICFCFEHFFLYSTNQSIEICCWVIQKPSTAIATNTTPKAMPMHCLLMHTRWKLNTLSNRGNSEKLAMLKKSFDKIQLKMQFVCTHFKTKILFLKHEFSFILLNLFLFLKLEIFQNILFPELFKREEKENIIKKRVKSTK